LRPGYRSACVLFDTGVAAFMHHAAHCIRVGLCRFARAGQSADS
jgi:hypothetical protein